MRFLCLFFSHEIFKTNTVGMGKLPIFHRKIPLLGIVTRLCFSKKKNSCSGQKGVLGGLAPSQKKIFEILKENSEN